MNSQDLTPSDSILAAAIQQFKSLRPGQISRVSRLVRALVEGPEYSVNRDSDFVDEEFAAEFGDQLLLHHYGSAIPLTKDKFEYALVDALTQADHEASKLPNGNPGEDIVVDNVAWSLKTQADANIKVQQIHISKFMELGKGAWETEGDISALRDRMFHHMRAYERIFTLRCLSRTTVADAQEFEYELVEIPKDLLLRADGEPIQIKASSRQIPKPASCYVYDEVGLAFELYFDGGTERKLQVRSLAKRNCIVHATWRVKVVA